MHKETKEAPIKTASIAKAAHYNDLNGQLETSNGERRLWRIAKSRDHQLEDIKKFFDINNPSSPFEGCLTQYVLSVSDS